MNGLKSIIAYYRRKRSVTLLWHHGLVFVVAIMIMVSVGTFSWSSIKALRTHPRSSSIVMLATVASVVFTHNLAIGVLVGVLLVLLFGALSLSGLPIQLTPDVAVPFYIAEAHIPFYRKVLFLAFIIFIAVIAAFVQFVEMFVERFSPALYYALGIFLPLITVNCAILGASLFMVLREYTLVQSAAFGLGAGLGWTLAILIMAGLRQKMGYSNVPEPLRGTGVVMLITGVLAMTFMGFAGMMNIQ